ncbi:hypothetical protein N7462_000079 [Penicillium macrosclerotiorum]|uniref:uncharacterized protein n=1 Tax=Penicillium macrosclerotiorum TaxID=303699 RepID=UPI0025482069|nr:uncharacterized protein N7462_000079 [Penicillium macrosclerotiorum]KAJ5698074.1 hypothetical protein N7462_000079 [Penicillium macrosclerotiorum]
MKVTLKEWNAVATWHWDMPEDEVCGICRVQFDGTCPTCKFPGDDCSLRESLRASESFTDWGLLGNDADLDHSSWQMWPFIPYEFEWKQNEDE